MIDSESLVVLCSSRNLHTKTNILGGGDNYHNCISVTSSWWEGMCGITSEYHSTLVISLDNFWGKFPKPSAFQINIVDLWLERWLQHIENHFFSCGVFLSLFQSHEVIIRQANRDLHDKHAFSFGVIDETSYDIAIVDKMEHCVFVLIIK